MFSKIFCVTVVCQNYLSGRRRSHGLSKGKNEVYIRRAVVAINLAAGTSMI
jgi:hypothetical protein